MVKNILRIVHSVIIVGLIARIINEELCTPLIFGVEVGITLFRALLQKRLMARHTKVQIIASMVLGYIMFPNKAQFVSWIYLVKGIQVHQSLKAFRKDFFSSSAIKYVAFVFDVLRFTVCEFIFLAVVIVFYRFFADCDAQPLPENYVIMYQLAVTASTIGYGDITPKSKYQMIFFTYTIPIICGSFVIFTNSLVEVYTDTFLKEDEEEIRQLPKQEKME